MQPVLIEIGDFAVRSYGVMLFLAFVTATIVVFVEFERRGWDVGDVAGTIFAAALGGLSGARLFSALFRWQTFANDPSGYLTDPSVGLTFYGGLIGGTLAVIGYILWKGYPVLAVADVAGLAVPLAYAVGRIGCFLVGDDYGVATSLPWGMAFPEGSPPITTPVHPTQLYEVVGGLAIFGIGWILREGDRPAGSLAGVALILMGVERFLVELVRWNPEIALGLTVAQWISAGLIVLGGFLLARSSEEHDLARRGRR